jgi:hypothetical protein
MLSNTNVGRGRLETILATTCAKRNRWFLEDGVNSSPSVALTRLETRARWMLIASNPGGNS